MKKIIGFAVTVFTVATLFAAARPSLDGRALVADTGTMPKGLFARTIGYLPGDSVAVTNPATGSTVDVLILGAIDPTEGVAILLSPEAADKLNIKKDSNVQVKITKRAGSLDEAVSGTAMLAEGEDEYDSFASGSAFDDTPIEFTKVDVEETPLLAQEYSPSAIVEEFPDESDSSGNIFDDLPSYDVGGTGESYSPADIIIPEYTDETTYRPEYDLGTPVEEVPAPVTEDTAVVETYPASPVETSVEEPYTGYANYGDYGDYGSPTEITEEVPEYEETSGVIEDYANYTEPAEPVEQDFVESNALTATELEEPVDVAPAFEDAAKSEYYTIDVPETTPAVPETTSVPEAPLSETAAVPVEEPAVPAAEETAYQSIVLVPVEEKPPVSEPPAPAASVVAPVAEPAPGAETPAPSEMEKHVVPSLKALRGGMYYVQIASLSKQENIDAILQKYGAKYPIVLVPLASGAAYQVLVGPLNGDEYPAVLEKFKSFGYKDAFLRKIRESSVYDPK